MKKILSFVLMMCVLMTVPMFAFAAVSGDEPLTIGTPFMITNAGQGPRAARWVDCWSAAPAR